MSTDHYLARSTALGWVGGVPRFEERVMRLRAFRSTGLPAAAVQALALLPVPVRETQRRLLRLGVHRPLTGRVTSTLRILAAESLGVAVDEFDDEALPANVAQYLRWAGHRHVLIHEFTLDRIVGVDPRLRPVTSGEDGALVYRLQWAGMTQQALIAALRCVPVSAIPCHVWLPSLLMTSSPFYASQLIAREPLASWPCWRAWADSEETPERRFLRASTGHLHWRDAGVPDDVLRLLHALGPTP